MITGWHGANARAQGGAASPTNIEGITVAGKAAVASKPNRLEIDLEISASSEMTADVVVKYRDAKKRLQDAFTALKMNNVTIEERTLAVEQKGQFFNPYMMDGPPSRKGKVEIQLTRKLLLSCNNIRNLDEEGLLQLVGKLVDVAQDAGARVGASQEVNPYVYRYGAQNSGLVRFILDDFDALQEKVYESAIKDARSRAERLAKLSGVELAGVAGVREVFLPGERGSSNMNIMYYYGDTMGSDNDEMPKKQLVASRFYEIPIKVELQVRFATSPRKGGS